jgi:lysyl-tRNA synthetase class 1
VERYAPTDYQFTPRDEQTATPAELNDQQRAFLVKANQLVDSQTWEPVALQQALYELAKSTCGPRPGFEAIYQVFLGKKSGPRAAWFLLAMDKKLRTLKMSLLNL